MAFSLALKESLRAQLVGRSLHDVGTPAVVLDLAKVEANCNLMLETVEKLGLGWRAHIKTHKTTELTRLQVGDQNTSPVNLVVSTVLEAESIVPLLREYQGAGRKVNVLYGFPLLGSAVDRLARVSASLGAGGLSVLVDHAEQVAHLTSLTSKSSGLPPEVFLKVDMGTHRAGVPLPPPPTTTTTTVAAAIAPTDSQCARVAAAILRAEAAGHCVFRGLYAHAGHSYSTQRDWEALGILRAEFDALRRVAREIVRPARATLSPRRSEEPFVLTVGATPTATSLQHPAFRSSVAGEQDGAAAEAEEEAQREVQRLRALMADLRADGLALEVHAGVYPALDLQQVATHARDGARHLAAEDVALSVLADVASVYAGRGGADGSTDEALVNAGTLALGREPVQNVGGAGAGYAAWGVVVPWNGANVAEPVGRAFPAADGHCGWQVGGISQEHGILRWVGDAAGGARPVPLRVGQRVRIWPNHACIASAGYGHFLVVDSRNSGREDEIVDVWPRWRGW